MGGSLKTRIWRSYALSSKLLSTGLPSIILKVMDRMKQTRQSSKSCITQFTNLDETGNSRSIWLHGLIKLVFKHRRGIHPFLWFMEWMLHCLLRLRFLLCESLWEASSLMMTIEYFGWNYWVNIGKFHSIIFEHTRKGCLRAIIRRLDHETSKWVISSWERTLRINDNKYRKESLSPIDLSLCCHCSVWVQHLSALHH